MARAIKLQDDNYLDSSAIVHNRVPLNEILDDVYSTNETKTNKVWIDGKPIYRKVITGSSTSSKVATINFDIGINLINVYGTLKGSRTLTEVVFGDAQAVVISADGKEITIYSNSDLNTSFTYTIVIEYTKLTD